MLRRLCASLLGFVIVSTSLAQTRPTTATTRRAVIVPPGFKVVDADVRKALAEPVDEQWVRQALVSQAPTTLPSTMPSDLIARMQAGRETIKKSIAGDLALENLADIEKNLVDTFDLAMNHLDELNLPLFYMVSTEQKVAELLKSGWSDPRFYYNRAADRIQIRPTQISAGTEADDVIVAVFYQSGDSPPTKTLRLSEKISETERMLADSVAVQAKLDCFSAMANLVLKLGTDPLKLKLDQDWLGIGLARVLASEYSAELTGMLKEQWLGDLVRPSPNNPLRLGSIDLLHPNPVSDMRAEAVPFYLDAYRRKSASAVLTWVKKAGHENIPKLVRAIRQNPPADGEALLKLMQQIGGADISADVRASN